MSAPEEKIRFGRVLRPYGIRGQLKVQLVNQNSPHLRRNQKIEITSKSGLSLVLSVGEVRWSSAGSPVVHFVGIDSRTEAEMLAGAEMFINRRDLDPVRDGEFYLIDVLNFQVRGTSGEIWGKVDSIQSNGPQDLIAVKGLDELEYLIPLVGPLFHGVDFEQQAVIADQPEYI